MLDGPSVDALLGGARFTSIYADWLGPREQRLRSRFRSLLPLRETKILLLNATKGPQLFPSIVDFFALLQETQPKLRVTSASYFDEIFNLSRGVAQKGLTVVSVGEVASWSAAELNRFDVVLAVGPSTALAQLIAMRGLACRLVCFDLAFYHQLIEGSAGAFLREERVVPDLGPPRNSVVCYSCQPQAKVVRDLSRAGFLPGGVDQTGARWIFRWFNYIPLGLAYQTYYESDRHAFDVALLGTSGRKYGDIDPKALRGRRVLFVGRVGDAPELERLRAEVPITVVSHVDEDTYARLLALCRCVVLPIEWPGSNVFLSVVDVLASGKPLVTARRIGLARLERERAPIAFYHAVPIRRLTRALLSAALDDVLRDEVRSREMGARAIAFAKERLDIYDVLMTILDEQVLPAAASR